MLERNLRNINVDYEDYKTLRKPTSKGTIVLSGKIKREKNRLIDEIEDGLREWEEYERNKISQSDNS